MARHLQLRHAHAAYLFHVRQSFFCDKAKLSSENIVFGGLGTGKASVALSPFFEVAGFGFGHMRGQKYCT